MSKIVEIIKNYNVQLALKNIFSKIDEIIRYINSNPSGGGTVTDVTASAPLSSTGGTAPDISIPMADTNTDGYLSSTDWDTFNQKQNALGFTPENVINKSTDITLSANSDTLYPTQKAIKTYADGLVVGLLDDRGNYDASGNVFPSSGGSGTAGAILKGDLWYISVGGTLGGTSVVVGSSVRALVDTPGQTSSNWSILNVGLGYVPENQANKGVANGYAPLNSSGKINSTFLPVREIPIQIGWITEAFNPANSTTYYFGNPLGTPSTGNSNVVRRITMPKTGRITALYSNWNNQTVSSNENNTIQIRNITTNTTVIVTTTFQYVGQSQLNVILGTPLNVNQNDLIDIIWTTPIYVTKPTQSRVFGFIILEY